jgi:hypothetical protein
MPLSASALGPLLKNAASGLDPDLLQSDPDAARDAMFLAFAQAIIDHITSSAVVTVTGVTAGAAAASGTIT